VFVRVEAFEVEDDITPSESDFGKEAADVADVADEGDDNEAFFCIVRRFKRRSVFKIL